MASNCGGSELANELLPALTAGKDFSLPDIDFDSPDYQFPNPVNNPLYKPVNSLTNDDLTTKVVDGTGTFDVVMTSVKAHLREEYDKSRITGADYTKAYIELSAAVLGNSVQYLLSKEQSYWSAVVAQMQAQRAQIDVIIGRMQLATTRAQYEIARVQLMTGEAEYALTKMKIASEDATYCNILAQTAQTKYTTEQILPIQKDAAKEQMESVRAQTLDTRTDGADVKGAIGKQKELHAQQIISFQRDAEVKAGRMFTEAWITQKTIDEGLVAPPSFTNANVEIVLQKIRSSNNFV